MASVRVVVREDLGVAELCAMSRTALERPLFHAGELLVAVPIDAGLVLGAHQRVHELADLGATTVYQRGSGGAEARVGTGTLWLQLALEQSGALVPCAPDRLLNRYVRPLLRAITKVGVLAHYFERDWVSGAKRPVATIAFAHDTSTGRALVEAIVAVETPFAVRARGSFMGKSPATLAELGARGGPAALAAAVLASYESAYGAAPGGAGAASGEPFAITPAADLVSEPPWTSSRAEAIGIVGAGRDRLGRFRVGGEVMVSRDALASLEAELAVLSAPVDRDAVGTLVDSTLGAAGVALFGVRSLASIRDVIVEGLG